MLFLHGGPGMTAELERRRFGTSLPVAWWDQPAVAADARQPLEVLVGAAAAQVTRLSEEYGKPIAVLANSFGAYLVRALVDRIPERIGGISICGGIWDLGVAILHLALHFANRHGDVDLAIACSEAASSDDPRQYLALALRVAARPDFLDCYWSPTALQPREAMRALAAEGRLIDLTTCQAVIAAALTVQQVPPSVSHAGEVRVVLGRFDPYFDTSDVAAWERLWPSATVEIVEAGHFPHLELPPAAWMPP